MATLYFGVINSTTCIDAQGCYFREGDRVNTNETSSVLPSDYANDANGGAAADSAGIFLHSDGTYVLNVAKRTFRYFANGRSELVTGSNANHTTTVSNGNINLTVVGDGTTSTSATDNRFTLNGHTKYKLKSDNGNISIKAENGKVSSKQRTFKSTTKGAYVTCAYGYKESNFNGTSTSLSASLGLYGYVAAFFEAKTLDFGAKILSMSVTGWKQSVTGIKLKIGVRFHKVAGLDHKYAFIYIKCRGYQAETATVKIDAGAFDGNTRAAEMRNVLAKVGTAGGPTTIAALQSKFPG